MSNPPDFDLSKAHKYFSASCFNSAWDLINKPDRTTAEDEQMLRTSMASAWHWTQREDSTPTNLSIAYWQISRVYTLMRQVENARRYGQMCLYVSLKNNVEPVFLGFAYEALARTEMIAGNRTNMENYLEEARRAAALVTDEEDKQQLLADLETIQ
jgi:hypothetical protein